MVLKIEDGEKVLPVEHMTTAMTLQSIAVADCLGRMIPQEGVDYDMELIFSKAHESSVRMNIIPHTDKGEWWRRYVLEMIKKYPPEVTTPPSALREENPDENKLS